MKCHFKRNLNYYEIYKCNYKKNCECEKTHCQYIDGIEGCKYTTNWNYAKRTPINYIKKIINNIRRCS